MMRMIRAAEDKARLSLQTYLVKQLRTRRPTLWLVSGGSNIPHAVSIMAHIPIELTSHLTVMPIDERYSTVGHADSNIQQLQHAGFDPKHGVLLPILTGDTLQRTVHSFAETARIQFAAHSVIVGQVGIGSDGHTAGILPGSPAAAELTALAIGYQAADYTRITLTFPALRHITTAYAFAYGSEKRMALARLRDQQLALDIQPAQILKAIPQAYVYNDQMEEQEGLL